MTVQVTTLDINRIVTQYHTDLLRMAFVYLKDTHLAEDAIQEAFIRVYKYQHLYKGEASEKTWVTQIAINVCKKFLRSAWNRNVDAAQALDSIIVEDETKKSDKTVVLEIMKLPPKYKDVILLFYYQDFTTKEIARALEVSENAVSIRLNRARNILRKKLEGWFFDE